MLGDGGRSWQDDKEIGCSVIGSFPSLIIVRLTKVMSDHLFLWVRPLIQILLVKWAQNFLSPQGRGSLKTLRIPQTILGWLVLNLTLTTTN